MSNVAYKERDIKEIQKRERIDFLYKVIKKILNLFKKNKKVSSIATYPLITIEEELIELYNKLMWAYPYRNNLSIDIYVSKDLINFDFSRINKIPNQRNYLKSNNKHIRLVTDLNLSKDKILFLKAKELFKFNLFKFDKTEILDKNYFSSTEGVLLQNLYFDVLESIEQNNFQENSKKNYITMISKNKNKDKAYCFVTGPSFDKYDNYSYEEDSFKIICNSTVKNDTFLRFIGKPDLLVFADPVFHFSPCEYSAMFRDYVINVFNKYKCYISVPERTVPLLLNHYPELKNHLIGMKIEKNQFNFPTENNFYVKASSNILTLLMIPIASSLCDEINIIGADGRNPDEKYFWKHSSSAQFDDLMDSVFNSHPSFFRDRDYKDYYEEHCEFLSKLINYGESLNKKYFTLTDSHIPVLKKRVKND